ncbi:hypothetical protein GHT06_012502 [Daphnia sinensis]|uniref:Nucleolar protein 9 n=1 Tax=Daphnia sinensis TaxID=1820382 RepID=A0AAD5LPE2_9CRUS|nr:hypothetical protein GHT06_012502 [Daphnia sinensis]
MASRYSRGGRGGRVKKKHTFLVKARKYGRIGLYGRGKNVDEETYNYFLRVMERLKEEFEDDEEKDMFVVNVFEQTKGKEMDLICNQVVSKVMEKLLPLAKNETLEFYADLLLQNMRIVCTDCYASHVLETVMRICLEKISKTNPEDGTDPHSAFCLKWLCSVCRYAFNNVEEFISDIYASHVLRTSLGYLSGAELDTLLMKSYRSRRHMDNTESSDAVPKYESAEFVTMLRDFGERFASWPQLHDMVHSQDSSAVIQTVLYCLKKSAPDICKKLLDFLVKDILAAMQPDDVFSSAAVVHTLEACVTVSDDETFRQLYQTYFKGRLKAFSGNFDLKFSVVRLLDAVKDKEVFAEIFEELAPAMEDIFAAGCGTVVFSLANTCKRLSTLQAKFLQSLMETFHCFTPETRQIKIVPLVSRLITYEVAEQPADDQPAFKYNFIGSQIVQTLLHFGKPIKIVQSLLEMDTSQLRDLLNDTFGSRILDAFYSAEFVGEKSHDKLFQKLQGCFYSLATSKFGSRALDTIWQASSVKTRQLIGEELLQKETALMGDFYGRLLFGKYALSLLKKQKVDWKTMQEKENKKRKLFADIVDPLLDGGEIKKKKKTKS